MGPIQDLSDPIEENQRWIALTEEVSKSTSVSNATDAIALFLDSERVAEDLLYALEEESKWGISVVIRAWDPAVTLQSEFRAFVWDRKMNCMVR